MTKPAASAPPVVRYSDDDCRVIIQDWSLADPDQATAINLAREVLRLREQARAAGKHAHLWEGSSCYTCGATR